MELPTFVALFGAGFLGSLVGHLVTLLVKRTEFSREDHARWVGERRDAYATVIDAFTKMQLTALLGEVAAESGAANWLSRHATEVEEQLNQSDAPVAVLRLLAPESMLDELELLVRAARAVYVAFGEAHRTGMANHNEIASRRQELVTRIERFTKLARQDIKA